MIDTVYYDGDSYSCFGVDKNTGNYLAEHYNAQLIHQGCTGKSPAEIINDFLNADHNDHTLYFIGIGILPRNINLDYHGNIARLTREQYAKKFADSFITEGYHLLVDLLLLSGYCRSKKLNYLIHNLDYEAFYKFATLDQFKNVVDDFKSDPNLVGFFDDCSLHHLMKQHNLPGFDADQYIDMSHPTEEGHRMYANFLISRIANLCKSDTSKHTDINPT
jgi:hypothetical protein